MTKFKSKGLQQSHNEPQNGKRIIGYGPVPLAHQAVSYAKQCVPFWGWVFP